MEPPNNEKLVWMRPPSSAVTGPPSSPSSPCFLLSSPFVFSSLLFSCRCLCVLSRHSQGFRHSQGSESELPPWRWRPRAACCCSARRPHSPRSPSTSPAASQAAFEMSATRLALSKSPPTGRCLTSWIFYLRFNFQ